MVIKQLSIEDFRIIQDQRFEPSPGLNLFYGDNASGKTSILEAINVLSSLRSFRSAKLKELERYGRQGFKVYGVLADEYGHEQPVGIARIKGELDLRIAGAKVRKTSDLASRLPVQTVHPDSHLIISGGPKQRRRYLDWGVFHVEHEYHNQWRVYEKALSQRNAALRRDQIGRTGGAWNAVLSDAAERVHSYREYYLEGLQAILPAYSHEISGTKRVDMEYYPGWDTAKDLGVVLEETLERDKMRGFTRSGPHRADLIFTVNGKPADKHISRGQQKMLVFAMLLSQVVLFKQRTEKNCVLLLDDLAAELDIKHRTRLLKILQEMNVQLFISMVSPDSIQLGNWTQHKMFHVEQGKIREVL